MLIEQNGVYGHVLAPDEAVAMMAALEYKANDAYRLSDHKLRQESWKKRGYLHSSEFILRLKRINPFVFVQQQINFPNEWGLYVDVRGKLTYLSGIRKGYMPEFSYTVPDKRDLDETEVRGWRTALVRMLNYGVLTWQQVQREFGDAPGNGGATWRKQTRAHRCGQSQVQHRNLINKLTGDKTYA